MNEFVAPLPEGTKLGCYLVVGLQRREPSYYVYSVRHRETGDVYDLWEFVGENVSRAPGLREILVSEDDSSFYAESELDFLSSVPIGDLNRFAALNTQYVLYPEGFGRDSVLPFEADPMSFAFEGENASPPILTQEVKEDPILEESSESSPQEEIIQQLPTDEGNNIPAIENTEEHQIVFVDGKATFQSEYLESDKSAMVKKWINRFCHFLCIIIVVIAIVWAITIILEDPSGQKESPFAPSQTEDTSPPQPKVVEDEG